ncbi:outer membrane beta-barrel family protein [Limibacterium fermenti]|uniref:outer membrane beta-barrel family protein n=1 Tax=Limibacterium fermenti TaxID=3229863 RepID=UPI003A61F238
MNNYRIVCIFALFLCATAGFPENISGYVKDRSNAVVSFANIVLINKNDSSFIAGSVSDNTGFFTISPPVGIKTESILIKVSYLGYKTAYLKPVSGIQNIVLEEDSHVLVEVMVKARKPSYRLTSEGITTNVSGTLLSRLGSGNDVLAHIPGVYKKEDGFEVLGKGSPEIYLNGRKLYNLSELEDLKSEDIKNVEVITTPGAKYSATVRAVIRIQTVKPVGEGFGANIRSSYYQGANADFVEQLSWNYRNKKLDLFGNHSYLNQTTRAQSELTQYINSDTLWQQVIEQLGFYKNIKLTNSLGVNYLLDKNNQIGLKYTIITQPDIRNKGTLQSDILANGVSFDNLISDNRETISSVPVHQINTYYKGNIGKVSLDVEADYLYNKRNEYATYNEQSAYQESRLVNSYSRTRNELFASKFVLGFKAGATEISLGAEFTSTTRYDMYDNTEGYIDASNNEIKERHISPFAYLSSQLSFGQLTVGLRYEHVWSDYRENTKHIDSQSRKYGNLFPNLTFATQLGKNQMMFSYSLKTRRPAYSQLSNNITYGNRFTYQTGNPFLRQERIHDLSLAVVRNFVQMSIGYNDRRNAIIYSTEMYKGSGSISLYSFENINSIKSASLQAALSPQIGIWTPALSLGVTKQWFSVNTQSGNIKMNSPILNASWSNTLDFGKSWMGKVDMSYTSRGDNENCKMTRAVFITDATIYKNWLNNRLSLAVGVSDVFHSQKEGNDLFFYQTSTSQISWTDSREFFVTLRYKFNTTKSRYKGTGAGRSEADRF